VQVAARSILASNLSAPSENAHRLKRAAAWSLHCGALEASTMADLNDNLRTPRHNAGFFPPDYLQAEYERYIRACEEYHARKRDRRPGTTQIPKGIFHSWDDGMA
jgi:hypothetical protein